ncbi:MAG: Mur ligase family protein [Rhodothermales bacterium]
MNPRAATGTDRLLALPRFATDGSVALKPGFDRIAALLDALGHPERTFRTVLVAGTNGKGSVAAMLSALLTASGHRAGLHTSPHLRHITERMRVDGRAAPAEWLDAMAERHAEDLDRISPSFFEATVAFSLAWFAHEGVDVAVVEVGLGGRLDATNILDAEASAIVSIGFDHMDLLGHTLPDIAREKAGIAKPGRPLIVGAMPAEALRAIEDVARTIGADVIHAPGVALPDDVIVDLPGAHQRGNARVALALMQALDPHAPAVREGLASVRALSGLRARLEVLSERPRFVVDIGHNPEAIATALAGLAAMDGPHAYTVVIGMLGDKDAAGVGRVLAEFGVDAVWTVPTQGSRGRSAEALASDLALRAEPLPSVAHAVQRARREGRNALFIGSHDVAAAALDAVLDE